MKEAPTSNAKKAPPAKIRESLPQQKQWRSKSIKINNLCTNIVKKLYLGAEKNGGENTEQGAVFKVVTEPSEDILESQNCSHRIES